MCGLGPCLSEVVYSKFLALTWRFQSSGRPRPRAWGVTVQQGRSEKVHEQTHYLLTN